MCRADRWRIIYMGPQWAYTTEAMLVISGPRECAYFKLPDGRWFLTPLGFDGHFVAVEFPPE